MLDKCTRPPPKNYVKLAPLLDDEMLQLWRKAIPRADKEFGYLNKVCEEHFHENDVIKNYEHKFPDGTTQILERGRAVLKHGAIPSIFRNLPAYLSKPKKRKEPMLRIPVPNKKKAVASTLDVVVSVDSGMQFDLKNDMKLVKLPSAWWGVQTTPNYVIWAKWNQNYVAEKKIIITDDLGVKIFLKDFELKCDEKINSTNDISSLIQKVENYVACAGVNVKSNYNCLGFLPITNKPGPDSEWCDVCKKQRKNVARRKHAVKLINRSKVLYQRIVCAKRKCSRLTKKVSSLKEEIICLKSKCANVDTKIIERALVQFPPPQQEAIHACITAAKRTGKSKNGIRYTLQWIYECLLIRIKSKKAYEHLRSHNILALPSIKTLSRYIKKIKGTYGFQSIVFEMMKKEAASMDPSNRRGTLLLDEMKVSSAVEFNPQTLKIEGFIDLEKYSDSQKKGVKGDHVLVIMFQPFKGKWVQALGCFLSKNNISGTILHHLVLECIILLENSGYFVDVVTSDGATWNRKMWSHFGISESNVSCSHPCNSARRLWFISDFPHLIKNVRNAMTDKKCMKTPDGIINLEFWESVLKIDNPKAFNLKACPKLKFQHIHPKGYQKMNVAMAFQFFSHSAACAMELYKDKDIRLKDSNGCIRFIKRLDALIDIMNSRTPQTALRKNSSAPKVIEDFVEYLIDWENCAKQNSSHFISDSTCYGLKITLKATLEIFKFLTTDCGFDFLMTARLNQDSLERFFGMMRNACGSNDHPDSTTFIQVFRLISTYSLVKPAKGSNIAGHEILHSILKFKDVKCTEDNQEEFNKKLHELILTGDDNVFFSNLQDHNYYQVNSSDQIVFFLAGYFAWRAKKLTKCIACRESLFSEENKENKISNFIKLKEKVRLSWPSDALYQLVNSVEQSTMNVTSKGLLHVDSLLDVLDDLEGSAAIPLLGCIDKEHQHEFTHRLLKLCIITRFHFICKQSNSINAFSTDKIKQHRKLSKL